MTASCISFYTLNGYILTPLNGKIPVHKKWQHTKYDAFYDAPGNYGVVLEASDLVVDVDPRNFQNGIDSFAKLGMAFNTFTVKTGGGGWHYYFKKPADFPIVNVLKEYPGIEFKTKGQQVVGAGSVTAAAYTIENDAQVAFAPQALLDLIRKKAEILKKKTNKQIEYSDDAQTQERFIHYLSQCPVAIEGQNGDMTTFSVACHGRDLGLSESKTSELMVIHYNPRCVPPWPNDEIAIKVINAYKYAANDAGTLSPAADFEAVVDEGGVSNWEFFANSTRLKPTFRNTLNVLLLPNTEISGLFQFNEFSEEICFTRESPWHRSEKDSKNWTDADAVMLKEWISDHRQFAPDLHLIHEAVLAIAKRNSVHPVKDFFQSLKWDGVPRLGKWLTTYLGVEDNIYTNAVGEIVLCAAVVRVFKPGEKFDSMMVLEGVQGQGKSRVCKCLGGEWHIGLRFDPHNKDFIDYIRSRLIVEIEEMDFATRAETNGIKAFITRGIDRARLAYARVTKDFPRQCVFIGTYNPVDGESSYLKDPTGNRRFWPIAVPQEHIDVAKFAADRDQLWAEAVVKSKTRPLFLTSEQEAILIAVQHVRRELDPWYEIIEPWLMANVPVGHRVSGSTVYVQCIGGKQENYGVQEGKRISGILRHMGWPKCQVWNHEKDRPDRGWQRPSIIDEMADL